MFWNADLENVEGTHTCFSSSKQLVMYANLNVESGYGNPKNLRLHCILPPLCSSFPVLGGYLIMLGV
jgi:hypothetical protein